MKVLRFLLLLIMLFNVVDSLFAVKVKVKVVYHSEKGPKDNNEDTLDVRTFNCTLAAGVYYGHGGGEVSSKAEAEFLPMILTQLGDMNLSPEMIEEAFSNFDRHCSIHIPFKDQKPVPAGQTPPPRKTSGSTATTVFINNENVVIAYLGDSRCVVFDDKCNVIYATQDHNVNSQVARDEIKDLGGECYLNEKNGYRQWYLKDGFKLLEMTRAFGDFFEDGHDRRKFKALSAQPTIASLRSSDCKYVVIASDGLWYILDTIQDKSFLENFFRTHARSSQEDIIEALFTQLKSILREHNGNENFVDDTTVIIISLDHSDSREEDPALDGE